MEAFRGLAGEANAKVLQELLDQIANSKGGTVPPALLAPDNDKMHRAVSKITSARADQTEVARGVSQA